MLLQTFQSAQVNAEGHPMHMAYSAQEDGALSESWQRLVSAQGQPVHCLSCEWGGKEGNWEHWETGACPCEASPFLAWFLMSVAWA